MSCPDCFKGTVHDHAAPTGKHETLYGRRCYIAEAPPSSTSKSAILYLTDAFGLSLVNNLVLADKYAAQTGFKVIMPDVIPGGPMDTSLMDSMASVFKPVGWFDLRGQLARIGAVLKVLRVMPPFLWRTRPAVAYPPILEFARKMKADLPAGAKMGVCGFCWGGYGSTALCKEATVEGGGARLIDAQFCGHPSGLKVPGMIVDAIAAFDVPYCMAIGDNDFLVNVDTVHKIEAALRQKVGEPADHNYEITIYDGCAHGFCVRADPSKPAESEAAQQALVQAVGWFKKYL